MSAGAPPKKNAIYTFGVGLVSQADTKLLQNNPTLAAGDALVSTDFGSTGNLATLPVVTPASSDIVKVTLSAAEMNGDDIMVVFSDAAGAQWGDLLIHIKTATRQIDDLAFPSVSGRNFVVETDGMIHADLKQWLGVAMSVLIAGRVDANAQAGIAPLGTAMRGTDGVDTATMRGTDAAALASAYTAARAAFLDNINGHTAQTGDSFARLGAPAAASIAADLLAIDNFVDDLETRVPDVISLANINAEVDTALDTAISELGVAIPTATPTVRTALMLIYMALRNKLDVTSTFKEIHNDAGTIITKKALTDDGTTYSEAEAESG